MRVLVAKACLGFKVQDSISVELVDFVIKKFYRWSISGVLKNGNKIFVLKITNFSKICGFYFSFEFLSAQPNEHRWNSNWEWIFGCNVPNIMAPVVTASEIIAMKEKKNNNNKIECIYSYLLSVVTSTSEKFTVWKPLQSIQSVIVHTQFFVFVRKRFVFYFELIALFVCVILSSFY